MGLKIRKKRKLGGRSASPAPVTFEAGKVTHVDDASFDSAVLGSDVPVLVDFWAPWCGPCKRVGPIVEEVARDMGSKARVVKVNVDVAKKVAARYSVRSIPTLAVFDGGKATKTMVGVQSKSALTAALLAAM